MNPLGLQLRLPDAWQREAVDEIRAGKDVIVAAPTGAGKTHVFELLIEAGWKGQAVYTVPTRALANDKLLEWRRRGWDVGIMTGDVVEKPEAPVVVATLETQRGRLLRGDGPTLLVIDEYQLLADPGRGANYELAIALAPATTRLLLLSGSVGNPEDVLKWLERLGRLACLVATGRRPVPLEEVFVEALPGRIPDSIRGFWPRVAARALANDLGPLLLFAPRRAAAESLARQIAGALPCQTPLFLDPAQERLAGPELARLLSRRIAYHHSGLTYAQRAQLVEPLAKAGKLRVVVATTGLAAGINFSLRSVAVTESEYLSDNHARRIEPDALLQMFGRAGRRGLDTVGYVLAVPERPRLIEARPRRLRRANHLDWPSLIAVMTAAHDQGRSPFEAAALFTRRLFSPTPERLGFEWSAAHSPAPCGLFSDADRRRLSRSSPEEMLGPNGWTPASEPRPMPLRQCAERQGESWRALAADPRHAAQPDIGGLGRLPDAQLPGIESRPGRRYGRRVILATRGEAGEWQTTPTLRSLIQDLPPRERPRFWKSLEPLIEWLRHIASSWTCGAELRELAVEQDRLFARLDPGVREIPAYPFGEEQAVGLVAPALRRNQAPECRVCPWFDACASQPDSPPGVADAWRRLGLVLADGTPTPRGRLFSHFIHGEGLAIAAALDEPNYPSDDLVYDLASLRAGSRFSIVSEKPDRLASACRSSYGQASYLGYLKDGLPEGFGHGAGEWMRDLLKLRGGQLAVEAPLTQGDVERCRVEWRSLLNHCLRLPSELHPRLKQLQEQIVGIQAQLV